MRDELNTAELREDYRRHVEAVKEEFNSWPSWKQSVLKKAVSVSSTDTEPELQCDNKNNEPDSVQTTKKKETIVILVHEKRKTNETR